MVTVDDRSAQQELELEGALRTETTLNWGNSAPLALLAFAVTTFMLSMVNANWISSAVQPVVLGVALMFGGLTQLLAGIIQLRTGNTWSGVLFSGFGAFWLSLFAIAQWFLKDVPPLQIGHALGLFLYAFGIFAVVMLITSLRTNPRYHAPFLLERRGVEGVRPSGRGASPTTTSAHGERPARLPGERGDVGLGDVRRELHHCILTSRSSKNMVAAATGG